MARIKRSVVKEMNPGDQVVGTISYEAALSKRSDTISTITATASGDVSVSNVSDSANIVTYAITADDVKNGSGCVKFKMTSAASPPTISNVEIKIKIGDLC